MKRSIRTKTRTLEVELIFNRGLGTITHYSLRSGQRFSDQSTNEISLPKGLAAQFGISERTVRHMMAAGHVQAFGIGAKLWRMDQASLDDYINIGQRACCDLALIRTPGM